MKTNFNEHLKQIEKDFEKQLSGIQDSEIEAILERAFLDTQELFKRNEQNDFKRVAYVIYRSYILGMLIERIGIKDITENAQ